MPRQKPLDPLIPLDDLKKVVGGLIRAPKPEKPAPHITNRASRTTESAEGPRLGEESPERLDDGTYVIGQLPQPPNHFGVFKRAFAEQYRDLGVKLVAKLHVTGLGQDHQLLAVLYADVLERLHIEDARARQVAELYRQTRS